MGDRGPKSSESIVIVAREFGVRPKAPGSLTAVQRQIWEDTVSSEPAGYFKTAAVRAILADYCRHVETAILLSREIEACDPAWLKLEDGLSRFDKLLALRARETRAVADSATKLRITNQSRYNPQTAATAAKRAGHQPPWDD